LRPRGRPEKEDLRDAEAFAAASFFAPAAVGLPAARGAAHGPRSRLPPVFARGRRRCNLPGAAHGPRSRLPPVFARSRRRCNLPGAWAQPPADLCALTEKS